MSLDGPKMRRSQSRPGAPKRACHAERAPGRPRRARRTVRALLGDAPRRRDLLIEHLHLIQDRYRQISAAHLAALAEEMRLSQAEVYEVATFYAHFDVVKEGEAPVAAADRPGLRQPHLRDGRRRGACWPSCKRSSSGPRCASSARPASAPATTRRPPRSATTSSTTPTRRTRRRGRRAAATRIRAIPRLLGYDAYRAGGGYAPARACCAPAQLDAEDGARRRSTTPACAASAAPASRPGASGARCAASRARG